MPQTPSKKMTSGPSSRVPCPHCGQPQNFAEHIGSGDWGSTLERGMVCECDDCHRRYVIANVQQVTMVTLQQHNR